MVVKVEVQFFYFRSPIMSLVVVNSGFFFVTPFVFMHLTPHLSLRCYHIYCLPQLSREWSNMVSTLCRRVTLYWLPKTSERVFLAFINVCKCPSMVLPDGSLCKFSLELIKIFTVVYKQLLPKSYEVMRDFCAMHIQICGFPRSSHANRLFKHLAPMNARCTKYLHINNSTITHSSCFCLRVFFVVYLCFL